LEKWRTPWRRKDKPTLSGDRLSHIYVGTEHILLGLLGEEEGPAWIVLKGLGLSLTQLRHEILEELKPNFTEPAEPSSGGVGRSK